MKKCLITGSTGLVGSSVIPLLKGWEIFETVRSVIDLSIRVETNEFPEDIDAVIHLANSRNFRDFPKQSEEIFNINVASTLALLEYARKTGAKTFVLASTGGVNFSGYDTDFYASTKQCAEILTRSYERFMNIIILRFYFVYGRNQKPPFIIPRLIKAVREGTPVRLDGYSGIRINPIYVTDAAEAVVKSLDLKHSTRVSVCGNEIVSIRSLSELIGEQIGKTPIYEMSGKIQNDMIGDNNYMTRLFGLPKVSLKEGIELCL